MSGASRGCSLCMTCSAFAALHSSLGQLPSSPSLAPLYSRSGHCHRISTALLALSDCCTDLVARRPHTKRFGASKIVASAVRTGSPYSVWHRHLAQHLLVRLLLLYRRCTALHMVEQRGEHGAGAPQDIKRGKLRTADSRKVGGTPRQQQPKYDIWDNRSVTVCEKSGTVGPRRPAALTERAGLQGTRHDPDERCADVGAYPAPVEERGVRIGAPGAVIKREENGGKRGWRQKRRREDRHVW